MMDLKEMEGKHILYLICLLTRFIQAMLPKNKEMKTVIEAVCNTWYWNVRYPGSGLWSDKGN